MLEEDEPIQGFLEEQRAIIIYYNQNVLHDANHPRKDYEEFLSACLIFPEEWFEIY